MSPKNLKTNASLGFVGLGAIGLPIAANLLKAGFCLQVHTQSRLAETSKQLMGAQSCSTPKDTAKGCDILLICVSDEIAVETVLFGPTGAESSLTEGAIVIDLSTISPSKARLFSARLAKRNIEYIDAPVTGGTEGAKDGTLTIFIGASNASFQKISSVLKAIGSAFYTFESVGKGQEVKAINQILVAGNCMALAEAIAIGEKLKLPINKVIKTLQKGAADSWFLRNRSKNMINNHYPLGFKIGLHSKDLNIALNIATDLGLNINITEGIRDIEKVLIQKGFEDDDISAMKLYIE